MRLYFSRLKPGYPGPQKLPPDVEGAWKIYTVLESSNPGSCTTRRDVSALSPEDKAHARRAYISMTERAQTGETFASLYDEKQCHEAHSFKYHAHDNHETKIFRLRLGGKVRVYFVYLPGKRIVILHTSPKRKDKLDRGEKADLEASARAVLDSVKENGFEGSEI